eukprot:IDg6499t1
MARKKRNFGAGASDALQTRRKCGMRGSAGALDGCGTISRALGGEHDGVELRVSSASDRSTRARALGTCANKWQLLSARRRCLLLVRAMDAKRFLSWAFSQAACLRNAGGRICGPWGVCTAVICSVQRSAWY